jgi:hypothetical protein
VSNAQGPTPQTRQEEIIRWLTITWLALCAAQLQAAPPSHTMPDRRLDVMETRSVRQKTPARAGAPARRQGNPLAGACEEHARWMIGLRGEGERIAAWLGFEAWREWVPPSLYARQVKRIAARAGRGALAPLLALARARIEAEAERPVEAARIARAAGWISEGILVCGEPVPPEGAGDASLAEGRPVHVSLPPYAQPFPLDLIVPTERLGTCRFLVPLRLPRPDVVTLGFDAPAGATLRLDGDPIHVRERMGEILPDGARLRVELDAGPHLLEVEIPDSNGGGPAPFYLRALGASGPLSGTGDGRAWLTPADALPSPEPPASPARVASRGGAFEALERLASAPSRAGCDAARIMGRAPADPLAGSLILCRESSRALTRRAQEPAAPLFYALLLERAGQAIAAADAARYAIRRAGGVYPDAELLLAGLLIERGATTAAIERVEALARRPRPGAFATQSELRVWSLAGQTRRHREALERALDERFDAPMAFQLLSALEELPDPTSAAALIERIARVYPWFVELDLARSRLASREPGAATEVQARLRRPILLGDRYLLQAAESLHHAGEDEQASRLVAAFLRQHPTHGRARQLARVLGVATRGQADAVFGPVDLPALRARLATLDADAALIDVQELRHRDIHLDATSRTWGRVVLACQGDPAALPRGYTLQYNYGVESLQILRARIYKGRGGFIDVLDDRIEILGEEQAELVEQGEQMIVPFEGMEPGDLMVLDFVNHEFGLPGLREHPSDVFFMRREVPVLNARVSVTYPASLPFRYELRSRRGRLEIDETREGDRRGVVVRARDLPRWDAEQPDDLFLYTTFASWRALGAYYGRLFASAGRIPGRVPELARRVTLGAGDRGARIERLHRWVADGVRYFGVELDVHAYVPYPVETVLRRGYGDCKDKAALLATLLGAVGIRAVPVLVASGDDDVLPPSLPTLAAFNHLMLHLPEDGLFLDPTLPHTPAGYLPEHVAGHHAYVIDDGHAKPGRLPEQSPDDNTFVEDLRVTPRSDQQYEVVGSLVLSGELAYALLSWSADPHLFTEETIKLTQRLYPSLDIEAFEPSARVEGSQPVVILRFKGTDRTICDARQVNGERVSARRCEGFTRDPLALQEQVSEWGDDFVYTYMGRFEFPMVAEERMAELPAFLRQEHDGALLRIDTSVVARDVTVRVLYRQTRRALAPDTFDALAQVWSERSQRVRFTRSSR